MLSNFDGLRVCIGSVTSSFSGMLSGSDSLSDDDASQSDAVSSGSKVFWKPCLELWAQARF